MPDVYLYAIDAGSDVKLRDPESADDATITAVASWTEGAEVFAMAVTVEASAGITASAAWTEGGEIFAAVVTVEATPITASAAWTEGAEIFAATIAVAGASSVSATAAWTEGAEVFAMSIEVQTFFARAPSGEGYHPRTQRAIVQRPPAIQGYDR